MFCRGERREGKGEDRGRYLGGTPLETEQDLDRQELKRTD